jgi:hypothetical protein
MQCSRLDNKHITILFYFSCLLTIVALKKTNCKATYYQYASLTSLLHLFFCMFKVQTPLHIPMLEWISFQLLKIIMHETCIFIVCFHEFWCFNLLDAIVEPLKLFPTLRRYLFPRGEFGLLICQEKYNKWCSKVLLIDIFLQSHRNVPWIGLCSIFRLQKMWPLALFQDLQMISTKNFKNFDIFTIAFHLCKTNVYLRVQSWFLEKHYNYIGVFLYFKFIHNVYNHYDCHICFNLLRYK